MSRIRTLGEKIQKSKKIWKEIVGMEKAIYTGPIRDIDGALITYNGKMNTGIFWWLKTERKYQKNIQILFS